MLMDEDDEDEYFKNTPKIERLVTVVGMKKILSNKFYIGLTHGPHGGWVKSTAHEAIIDPATFEKVQESLKGRKVSVQYEKKLPHPFRGVLRCAGCGRIYTPYTKKGILYFYSRCKDGCENKIKNVKLADIETSIADAIEKLVFTESELAEIDAKTSTDIAVMDAKRQIELEQINRKKKKVREDLAYIGTNKLTLLRLGAYTPEELLDEEKRLSSELNILQNQEAASDASMSQAIMEAIKLSELLNDVGNVYKEANSADREAITRKIFSELTLTNNTLQFKCKNGLKVLEQRFLPFCDPTGNRTRIYAVKGRCPNR